jgi:serine O-acetyltransferase
VITGADIYPETEIAPGFCLPHPTGVVLAGTFGRNVLVFSGAQIGGIATGDARDTGSPVLEDGCIVFAGAKVFGPIVLGRGTRVGANAVLLQSTPAGALAVGVPARIIVDAGSKPQ